MTLTNSTEDINVLRPLGVQSACGHLFTMKAVWKDTVIGITSL